MAAAGMAAAVPEAQAVTSTLVKRDVVETGGLTSGSSNTNDFLEVITVVMQQLVLLYRTPGARSGGLRTYDNQYEVGFFLEWSTPVPLSDVPFDTVVLPKHHEWTWATDLTKVRLLFPRHEYPRIFQAVGSFRGRARLAMAIETVARHRVATVPEEATWYLPHRECVRDVDLALRMATIPSGVYLDDGSEDLKRSFSLGFPDA